MTHATLPNLTTSQRAVLESLVPCVLAGAPPSTETLAEFVERCDRRLTALPPHRRAQLGLALDVLGSRIAVVITNARMKRFATLSLAEQTTCFAKWLRAAPAARRALRTP